MVPLKNIVTVEEVTKPDSFQRQDLKRVTAIYADLKKGSGIAPLEVARYPAILTHHKVPSGDRPESMPGAPFHADRDDSGRRFGVFSGGAQGR